MCGCARVLPVIGYNALLLRVNGINLNEQTTSVVQSMTTQRYTTFAATGDV
jgi:hypothetical protein